MAAHLTFALSTVLLVLVADPMLHAQGPLTEEQKAAWKDLNPDMSSTKVARVNEEFPLSDQENSAKWDPNLAMSDEFNGRKLDDSKWWPTNPDWKGREPGWFDPANVSVKDGSLRLTTRLAEPLQNLRRKATTSTRPQR